jgi:protein-tyrosine kinase
MKSVIIAPDYAQDMEASSEPARGPGDRLAPPELLARAPVGDDEMISLFRALQTLMPQKAHWTLGIISTHPGEGVSSVARGLARIVSRTPNAKVLICDVASDPRSRKARDKDATRTSVGDGGGRIDFTWLPGSQIALGVLGEPGAMNAIAADVESVRSMVHNVSAGFELVILDLPPVSESVIGPALAKAVDGVLLVVEAERTRAAAVRATEKTLRMYGGNVLGIVLNKRRFHIPDFIYRRL